MPKQCLYCHQWGYAIISLFLRMRRNKYNMHVVHVLSLMSRPFLSRPLQGFLRLVKATPGHSGCIRLSQRCRRKVHLIQRKCGAQFAQQVWTGCTSPDAICVLAISVRIVLPNWKMKAFFLMCTSCSRRGHDYEEIYKMTEAEANEMASIQQRFGFMGSILTYASATVLLPVAIANYNKR